MSKLYNEYIKPKVDRFAEEKLPGYKKIKKN